jgi:hypothetical protein
MPRKNRPLIYELSSLETEDSKGLAKTYISRDLSDQECREVQFMEFYQSLGLGIDGYKTHLLTPSETTKVLRQMRKDEREDWYTTIITNLVKRLNFDPVTIIPTLMSESSLPFEQHSLTTVFESSTER